MLAAAAAAKSLQSCPTLCGPIDGSPPGSPVPGILQARTLEWVAISFSNAWTWKVKVKLLSPVQLLVTPWTAGSSVHGIFQARVLEWGAIAFCNTMLRWILFKNTRMGRRKKKKNLAKGCSVHLNLSVFMFFYVPWKLTFPSKKRGAVRKG